MKLRVAIAILLGVGLAGGAQGAPYSEIGDAGHLPSSAQVVLGSGPLDSIGGSLTASTADMFQIFISNPALFSATTVGQPGTLGDTQLFLFNSAGMGVYANDDSVGLRSTLPAGHANGPTTPGLYYLAISGFDHDPTSPGGLIFPSTPFTGVFGPTGPGGGSAITGWGGTSAQGTYNVRLAGATFVPAPGALLLGLLGISGIGWVKRRMRMAE